MSAGLLALFLFILLALGFADKNWLNTPDKIWLRSPGANTGFIIPQGDGPYKGGAVKSREENPEGDSRPDTLPRQNEGGKGFPAAKSPRRKPIQAPSGGKSIKLKLKPWRPGFPEGSAGRRQWSPGHSRSPGWCPPPGGSSGPDPTPGGCSTGSRWPACGLPWP